MENYDWTEEKTEYSLEVIKDKNKTTILGSKQSGMQMNGKMFSTSILLTVAPNWTRTELQLKQQQIEVEF